LPANSRNSVVSRPSATDGLMLSIMSLWNLATVSLLAASTAACCRAARSRTNAHVENVSPASSVPSTTTVAATTARCRRTSFWI